MVSDNQASIFDEMKEPGTVRRRAMLPKWILVFCWIFAIVCTGSCLAAVVVMILHYQPVVAVYGIDENTASSLSYFICLTLFSIKAAAAIGLLTEKDWAVWVAIADAIIGLAACIYSMYFNMRYLHAVSLRLEIFLLTPYLVIMLNIRKDWAANRYAAQQAERSMLN